MIVIQQLKPHAFDIAFAGAINPGDIEAIETSLAPYLQDEGAVDAVIDLTQTNSAIAADIERLLVQTDKLGRLAVVGEQSAACALGRAAGQLMPKGQFKQFAPDQRADAQAFVLT